MESLLVSDQLKWVHFYLNFLDQETELKSNREKYRDLLKEFLMSTLDQDDRGNYYWEFDSPILISDDQSFKGIMAQRRVSEFTDEDKALKLIHDHGLEDRCLVRREIIEVDLDELYACNQEGIISDDEIDSIIEVDETYSLVRVKS